MSHIAHPVSEYVGIQHLFNTKSTFGIFTKHRHGMHRLNEIATKSFHQNLLGTENFTSKKSHRTSTGYAK